MAEEITTNEVLATKLDYMARDISSINKKIDSLDGIGRREFETHVKDSDDKVRARFVLSDQKIEEVAKEASFATKAVYGTISVVFLIIAGAIMNMLLK